MAVVNPEKLYAVHRKVKREHVPFLGSPPRWPIRHPNAPVFPQVEHNPKPITARGWRRQERK